MAELFRAGLQSVPRAQWEAGISLGLGVWNTLRLVILPQAARLAEFFNVVLHLQRQNFHIKSANITTGMKIRFTISPASALLDGGFSSSSFAAR